MKRESLTKCLQLAHDYNDQEVIDLISSKYRVAKVVVAQINVPPVPDQESWRIYQMSKIQAWDDILRWFAEANPTSPLLREKSLLDKLRDQVRHCELWLEYEADQKSSSPLARSNAEKEYAEKYKAEIDPTWKVGELKDTKNPINDPANNIYIHEYIKHIMEEWYSKLDAKDKKHGLDRVRVGENYNPLEDYYVWWGNLSELNKDDNRVQAALNAQHTVYLEPESYAAASAKTRITTSQLDPRYSRMMPEKISLYNLGLQENTFLVFGPSEIEWNGKKVTYHNPDRQNLDSLITELQNALVGIETKEPKEINDVDYTKGLKFLSNLLSYKGGRI